MSETPAPSLRDSYPIVAFSALCAFLSAPGQTFFISVFIPSFAAGFSIGAGDLGALYMAATLGAAALAPLTGSWIDRTDLRLFVVLTLTALAVACLVTASASTIMALFAGFLLLRLAGQGLMSHIAITSIVRYFVRRRGRALSITALGFPLAEATTPAAGLLLIGAFGWRDAYAIVAALLVVIAAPGLLLLIHNRRAFSEPPGGHHADRGKRHIRRAAMTLLRSRYFWMALPILLFMPFTSTALVFHIQIIAELKDWPGSLVGPAFLGFAAGHVAGLAASGDLVDRLGAKSMMPVMNAPLLLGLIVLAATPSSIGLFVFLALAGASAGLVQTTVGAMWAEVYGVERLGAIRSLAVMLMVAGAALGPAIVGAAIDDGASVALIAGAIAATGAFSSALAGVGARDRTPS